MWNDFPYGIMNIGLRCLIYSDNCKIRENALIRKDVRSRRSYTVITLDYKFHDLIQVSTSSHGLSGSLRLLGTRRKSRTQISCGWSRRESRLYNSPGARVKKGVQLERKDLMARNLTRAPWKPVLRGKNPTVLQCKRMRSKYEITDPTIVWKPAN